MRFKYSAKTRDGLETKRGEIDAPDQPSALKGLQTDGLIVYSLVPITKETNPLTILQNIWGVTLGDKVHLTETLGNMLTAGLALTKSLEILIAQAHKKKLNDILQAILNEVESGSQLSAALEKQGDTFSESYCSLIRAGEASGKLSEVLNRLAASMEKQRQFKSKVMGAMIYPGVVTFAMIGVFVMLMVFVVPQMTETYKVYEVQLPWSTQFMIALSDFMVNFWYIGLGIIVAMLFGLKYYYGTPGGKYLIDALLLKVPLISGIISQATVVEFSRTMALLADAGVPIIDGLRIVKNTIGNSLYRDSIDRFIDDVRHGYPLSQSITKEKIYPAFVSQMVVVGEETGTVGTRLDKIADYYEGEVDKVVKNLSVLIEPLIMIVLAVMVGFLIISVILPIYQLTSEFQ